MHLLFKVLCITINANTKVYTDFLEIKQIPAGVFDLRCQCPQVASVIRKGTYGHGINRLLKYKVEKRFTKKVMTFQRYNYIVLSK
jgi:hypothetical protein